MPFAQRLLSGEVLHMTADVTHARRGSIRHAFRYGVDYILLAPEAMRGPMLLSRNRTNLASYHDRDHGARAAMAGALHGRGMRWNAVDCRASPAWCWRC